MSLMHRVTNDKPKFKICSITIHGELFAYKEEHVKQK